MKKLVLLLVVSLFATRSFEQIPASAQGKWRGFKQPSESVDINTVVIVESKRIVFQYLTGSPIVFTIEKTDVHDLYRVFTPDNKKYQEMHMCVNKEGELHMMWYSSDGVTVYDDYKFKKDK